MTATIAAMAALAAGAGAANAATFHDCGNKLCLDMTREPDSDLVTDNDFVIPDGYLRYRVDVTNPTTSTATKVTLKFTVDPLKNRATLDSFQAPSSVKCSLSGNVVTCPLGSVKPTLPDSALTFSFVVKAPPSETPTDEPLSNVASISADARANDKQENPNDPTNEAFKLTDTLAVDFRQGLSASFVPADQELTLDTDTDGTGATSTDTRTAKFTLFASGFSTSAVVNDQVEDTFVCPSGLKCPSGGWTQAVIPGPLNDPLAPFVGRSRMVLELLYDSTARNGANPENYVLLHDKDYNAATTTYEPIKALCPPNPTPPCLLGRPQERPGGDLYVKALVDGNWRYR